MDKDHENVLLLPPLHFFLASYFSYFFEIHIDIWFIRRKSTYWTSVIDTKLVGDDFTKRPFFLSRIFAKSLRPLLTVFLRKHRLSLFTFQRSIALLLYSRDVLMNSSHRLLLEIGPYPSNLLPLQLMNLKEDLDLMKKYRPKGWWIDQIGHGVVWWRVNIDLHILMEHIIHSP